MNVSVLNFFFLVYLLVYGGPGGTWWDIFKGPVCEDVLSLSPNFLTYFGANRKLFSPARKSSAAHTLVMTCFCFVFRLLSLVLMSFVLLSRYSPILIT